jgi:exopolysaccharide biosynthesis polyprenyl glycosylphosphotransferase
MNKQIHTLKYVIIDFSSAALTWIVFNLFRKRIIESALFGYDVKLEFTGILLFQTILIACFWLLIYSFSGYYHNIYRKSRLQEFSYTLNHVILGTIFLFFALILNDFVANYTDYYYSFIVLLGLQFVFTYIPRNIITSNTINRIRIGRIGFNTIIIGSNGKAIDIIKAFSGRSKSAGYRLIGFVNLDSHVNPNLEAISTHLGSFPEVLKIIDTYKAEEVIIAIETNEHSQVEKIISQLQQSSTAIKITPDLFEILIGKTELSLIEGIPLLHVSSEISPVWVKNFKYLFDKVFALLFLVILSPLYLFTAIGVKITSSGPIIYKQKRIGLHGKEFTIYKFRSMTNNAEINGPELSSFNDSRITRFGQFMRRSRLDEIPQFLNVLKGDMAIVGPRPERKFFVDQIIEKAPEFRLLLKTKPGITSLGQVKFGYAENLEQMLQRLKIDIIYMKNMSLYLDFKILIFTILTILRGDGK